MVVTPNAEAAQRTVRAPHHGTRARATGPPVTLVDPDALIALEAQRQSFDIATAVRAENERELNALRDVALAQLKRDDEALRKWIEMI